MLFDTPYIDNYTKPIVALVQKQEQKPEPKKPTLYTIQPNDNLTKIAEAHTTTVERLFAANPELAHPDQLEPSKSLRIPESDEVLAERPLPVIIEASSVQVGQTSAPSGRSSVSKWSFPYGYCTYFASKQRPDLNIRGNAKDWIKWSNSQTPQIGAVAVNTWAAGGYGHVAIVTAIDGTRVQVTHMNYKGFGVVSTDWTDASYWAGYIL